MAVSTSFIFVRYLTQFHLQLTLTVTIGFKFGRTPISAAYATDRQEDDDGDEPIRSFQNPNLIIVRSARDLNRSLCTRSESDVARVLHPDVGSCDSSTDEFLKVHSAYATLTEPEQREDYDRSLVQRRAGVSSPVRSGGGYRSQRYEGDRLVLVETASIKFFLEILKV